MVTVLLIITVLTVGTTVGYFLRDGLDELSRHRAERLRIRVEQLKAQRRIHEHTGRAFGEMLDAARRHRHP